MLEMLLTKRDLFNIFIDSLLFSEAKILLNLFDKGRVNDPVPQ